MSYYNSEEIKKEANPLPCENGDNTVRNLIFGKQPVAINELCPIDGETATPRFNSPIDYPALTDGVKSDVYTYTDERWFRLTRGVSRSIIFRFDNLSAVKGFSIGFLKEDVSAVRLPRRVDVCLSENGVDWQRVCKCRDIFSDSPACRVDVTRDLENTYRALYVMFEIETVGHVWLDEIEVFGTTAVPADALSIVAENLDNETSSNIINAYPSYDALGGVRNILLSYNCIPRNKEAERRPGLGLITVDEYLPHLAYIDKDGEMKDTFFDGMLYLPYSMYTYSAEYKCAEGWKHYIENTFTENANVDALNKATAIVGEKLGIQNHKTRVYFSVLHTKVGYGDFPEKFGDIDDDGVDEVMDNFADRQKAIKWCIDTTIEKFKAGNYENLIHDAFYWFEEEIAYSNADETALLSWTVEYLHSLGYKLFWIPYYQASGFMEWKDLGFDVACMQPNFAFRDGIPTQRLYDNAEITKKLGMCYELEIGGSDPANVERYMKYLDCGAETGFMNSIKMYYQGGVPGEFYAAFKSSDPELRKVYDSTYLFAKEKYVSRNVK